MTTKSTTCGYCGNPFTSRYNSRTGWTQCCSKRCAARLRYGIPPGVEPDRRGRKNYPGATTHRGYGGQHQTLRAKWKRVVDAGNAQCHATICLHRTRWIAPGQPWDLGHTPDRTAWTGPEHRACNRADGGRRSPHATRYTPKHQQPRATQHAHAAAPSRTW